MLQKQLSEIKNFQRPLHELTLTELFATSGCGETRPPPAGLALGVQKAFEISLRKKQNKQSNPHYVIACQICIQSRNYA